MQLESLTTLDLEPGDVLVLEVRNRLTKNSYDRIKAKLEEVAPGHQVLIFEGGMSLRKMRTVSP